MSEHGVAPSPLERVTERAHTADLTPGPSPKERGADYGINKIIILTTSSPPSPKERVTERAHSADLTPSPSPRERGADYGINKIIILTTSSALSKGEGDGTRSLCCYRAQFPSWEGLGVC